MKFTFELASRDAHLVREQGMNRRFRLSCARVTNRFRRCATRLLRDARIQPSVRAISAGRSIEFKSIRSGELAGHIGFETDFRFVLPQILIGRPVAYFYAEA